MAYAASQLRRVVVFGIGPDWPSLLFLTVGCAVFLWLAIVLSLLFWPSKGLH